jgi:hypothetical protein
MAQAQALGSTGTGTQAGACAQPDCSEPRKGKGKYCRAHAAESRARFKALMAESKAKQDARRAGFDAVWDGAIASAMAQAQGAGGQVRITPANSAVAHWAVARGYAQRRPNAKGVWVRVNTGAQALAQACAENLTPLDKRAKFAYLTA